MMEQCLLEVVPSCEFWNCLYLHCYMMNLFLKLPFSFYLTIQSFFSLSLLSFSIKVSYSYRNIKPHVILGAAQNWKFRNNDFFYRYHLVQRFNLKNKKQYQQSKKSCSVINIIQYNIIYNRKSMLFIFEAFLFIYILFKWLMNFHKLESLKNF